MQLPCKIVLKPFPIKCFDEVMPLLLQPVITVYYIADTAAMIYRE